MVNSIWETHIWETHLYSSLYIKINTSCPVGFMPVLVTWLSLPCIHMCSHGNPSLHYVSLRGNLLINFFIIPMSSKTPGQQHMFRVISIQSSHFFPPISSLANTRGPARTDREHCLFSRDITESGTAESDAFTWSMDWIKAFASKLMIVA